MLMQSTVTETTCTLVSTAVVATDRITIAAQIDPSYSPGVANVHL